MDDELKRTVEAILFAAARRLELEELAKLCKSSEQDVLTVLTEWKSYLDESKSPTMLVQDGTAWKLTVREKYVAVIKKVVTKTELPKGHMETLAVVAYKAPVFQSKVVKIRTNKAYEHLSQLENSGFITREKSGRTRLLKLTPKFFEYFDINPSKLKQKFGSATAVEKAIESKEKEIEDIEASVKKETEKRLETPKIVLQPDKGPPKQLESYPSVQPLEEMLPTGVQVFMEQVGDLEVFDVPGAKPHPHSKHHKKKTKKKHEHDVHHKPKAEEPAEEKPEAPEVEETAKVEEKVEEKKDSEEKPGEKEEKKPEKEKLEEKEEPEVEEKPEKKEELEKKLTPAQKVTREAAKQAEKLKPREFEEGKGLFPEGIPPEIEAKIEERIKKMLTGEPKEKTEDPEKEEKKE